MSPVTASRRYTRKDLPEIEARLERARQAENPHEVVAAEAQLFWAQYSLKATGEMPWTEEDRRHFALEGSCVRPREGTILRHEGRLYERRKRVFQLPSGAVLATTHHWVLIEEHALPPR